MANRIPRRLDSNAILSITATIVSICALFVAAYQTILMREQQSAAVWPKLVIDNPYTTGLGNESSYRLVVRNVGIGPAIIRKVEIKAMGQKFTTMNNYAKAVLKQHGALDSLGFYDASELFPEDVIPQGEQIVLFDGYKSRFNEYLDHRRTHFTMIVEYESVYGEKWQATYPH